MRSQPLSLPLLPPGRGTPTNPPNRFEPITYEPFQESVDFNSSFLDEYPAPQTRFLRDDSQSILTHNDSPDVGFETSINPYRGCEHGCAYCYARPTHEYLGFSAGLDFETRIMVKEHAPALLRKELNAPRWQPRVIALSGVTDPYQPIERRLQLTRGCLEVLVAFRNPLAIVTKNALVRRDRDLLAELARYQAAGVFLSVTTLDAELAGKLEPRASRPTARLDAIASLAEVGVPVGVMLAPIIPGLNDHEIPALLKATREAGAQHAGYVLLRLPHGVADLFTDWLDRHYPQRREKVLGRVRAMRGGALNESRFRKRMRGEGMLADQINSLFALGCRQAGIGRGFPALSTAHFRRPGPRQGLLFA